MDFKEILKASNKDDFINFSLDSNGTGEVTLKDIFESNRTSFYVVQEFRWVSSLATDEIPALLPGIVTCLPTLIANLEKSFLVHVFHPSGIERVADTMFHGDSAAKT